MKKKKVKTKGLTVGEMITKQNNELTEAALDPMSWGKVTLTKNDLIIPRLILMQGTSDSVKKKLAQLGEIRDSLNNTLLADENKPLQVIPFYVYKKFKEMQIIESKGKIEKEFLRHVVIQDNPSLPGYNDDLPWQDKEEIDGKEYSIDRIRTYDVFFVLPELGRDVAYVMSFSSTNIKAAKNMLLQMALNQEQGKTPAANCFELKVSTKANDKNTWYIVEATLGRESTDQEQGKALKWYRRVQAGEAKAQEEEEEEVE